MLKKTGIVAAAVTAGLLAFTPLAFATNNQAGNQAGNQTASGGDCNISQTTGDATQKVGIGLVNVNDALSDIQLAAPICDNNINVQVAPIESPVTQVNR